MLQLMSAVNALSGGIGNLTTINKCSQVST